MNNKEQIDRSFSMMPRAYEKAWWDSTLTLEEYVVLSSLFSQANYMTGRKRILYSDYAPRLGREKTFVNKVFLSLKKKGLITFTHSSGSRHGVEVKVCNYPRYDGKTKKLTYINKQELCSTVGSVSATTKAELDNNLQRFDSMKSALFEPKKMSKDSDVDKGLNNDKSNNSISNKSIDSISKELINPDSYIPKTKEEEYLRDLAITIRDSNMAFLLGINAKHGIVPIQKAEALFKKSRLEKIHSLPRFFNNLVMQEVSKEK